MHFGSMVGTLVCQQCGCSTGVDEWIEGAPWQMVSAPDSQQGGLQQDLSVPIV